MNQKLIQNGQAFDPAQFEETFNKFMNEMLASQPIDFEIHQAWYQAAAESLRHTSPRQAGLSGDKLKALHEKAISKEPLTYWDFAGLNNALEDCTAHQLEGNLCYMSYFDVQELASQYAAKFNERFLIVKDLVMKKTVETLTPQAEGQNGRVRNMPRAEA